MALILTYHHVLDAASDPGYLCVSKEHFAQHVQVLREQFHPVPLSQAVKGLQDGRLMPDAVAVTFDDGYADNLYEARPLLERFEVPATVFVTSGFLDDGGEFWWDELERLLLSPGQLPKVLQLDVLRNAFCHQLDEVATYSKHMSEQLAGWKVWETPPTARHTLYLRLLSLMGAMSSVEQMATIEAVRSWAGEGQSDRHPRRRLSRAELRALGDGSLIEIGGHTVTHPKLSILGPDEQRSELLNCRLELEAALGERDVPGFAYPYGDYAQDTPTYVKESGFAWACSTAVGPALPGVDIFRLPRIHVEDQDGASFGALLRRLGEAQSAQG